MRTFNDIYNTVDRNFSPQRRSLIDLGVILSKAYSVLKNDKFIEYSPFEIKNSVIDTDRTTIERLIKELADLKADNNGTYVVQSEGVERTIADIKTLDIQTKNPAYEDKFAEMFDFSRLKAHLLYLINTSREGLILLKQQIILENIGKLNNKNERLNYLNSLFIRLKQNERLYDKVQFESLTKFVELELEKWNKIVEDKEKLKSFNSIDQLHDYIIKLIKERLNHNIRHLEGYRNFWRDEKCLKDQKKENEVQPFILSILKPYCDERDIKISRENTVSNGRIDMTFTYLNFNICLEIKKAHHGDVMNAINTQLTEYMIGEETEYGIYLVLWYKSDSGFDKPTKYNNLDEQIADMVIENDKFKIQILGIDCTKPISPSKR